MPVIAAAGDDRQDACNASPAGVTGTLTVMASDAHDRYAATNNYGRCTHIIAPGVDVPSTWAGLSGDGPSDPAGGSTRSRPTPEPLARPGWWAAWQPTTAPRAWAWPDNLYSVILQHALPNVIKGVPHGTPNRLALNDK
ncbi:S8 family serine peptidase [Streptomyces sp. KS 21]|uniref:S8 family serine peptidase n=1 Tax=Streptomyces sp. KS 21 TaxID=2485150 RepID=UPI00106393A8|nr:S8 family serine peptidase [Streptomyces sp. KS 21]